MSDQKRHILEGRAFVDNLATPAISGRAFVDTSSTMVELVDRSIFVRMWSVFAISRTIFFVDAMSFFVTFIQRVLASTNASEGTGNSTKNCSGSSPGLPRATKNRSKAPLGPHLEVLGRVLQLQKCSLGSSKRCRELSLEAQSAPRRQLGRPKSA